MDSDKVCVDDYCIGHVSATQNSCYDCIPDHGNLHCPLFLRLKDRVQRGPLYDSYSAIIREKIQLFYGRGRR